MDNYYITREPDHFLLLKSMIDFDGAAINENHAFVRDYAVINLMNFS